MKINRNKIKKPKALFMIYLIIALSFSVILIAPNVKADTDGCCELTKDGEYCLYTDKDNCDSSAIIADARCEYTSYCQEGCCYSEDDGYCYPNTPKARCEKRKGTWNEDATCSISQCKKGCCMISDQCSFITQTMCKRETSKYPGVSMIFDDSILTENECTDQCRSQEFGACVSSNKFCAFTTREACTETRQTGTQIGFHPSKLCSNPELGTTCAKQQYTECYQGKVYWFDSCGNRENIYMANKERSYNNGYILAVDRTCTANPDDKDCGNCDYSKGTVCGEALDIEPTYGDYICRDINCKSTTQSRASPDATGGPKKHGESWCLYEAAVGFGQDVVGSRHLKVSCQYGEEIIEPCKDYRKEFCIQSVVGGEPTTDLGSLFNLGEGYSEGFCVENKNEDCNICNKFFGDKKRDCCEDVKTKDCTILNGLCVPHIPPGIKFWDPSQEEKEICEKGNSACVVKYGKRGISSWKCIENCQCLLPVWFIAANKKCVAQGDCGAYYNIEGEFTNEGINTGGRAIINENAVSNWNDIITPPYMNEKFVTKKLFRIYFEVAAKKYNFFYVPVVGPVLGVIYSLIDYFGINTKTKVVFVKCSPWEAPDKTTDCEKCNTGLAPCSEYRCKSLGKSCEILNEGTENEMCIYEDSLDTTSPIIKSAQQDYRYTETDLGYTITQEIPPSTPITLAITTKNPATCKYSLDQGIPYNQMEYLFGTTFYDYNHTVTFSLPSELQDEEILKITNGGRYTLYIKCIDKPGNDNKKDYYINFQISTGPDFTPPKIELTSIQNNAYIAADLDKIELAAYLNEPSSCRWSTSDTDYSNMANTFTCVESGFDISSVYYGLYECITELPLELQKTNNYFFRCEDRSNNINTESYPYTLVSTIPLKITSLEPTGMVYSANPILKVTTSEGADNGNALCGFSTEYDEIYNMIQFFETNSTEHTQQLGPITSGIYAYYINCIDKAGNIARTSTTFEVEADLIAPEVSRIYKDSQQNMLVIEITEESTCEYSFEAFNYGSGIIILDSDGFTHKVSLSPENNIYLIACQDKYENQIEFEVIT